VTHFEFASAVGAVYEGVNEWTGAWTRNVRETSENATAKAGGFSDVRAAKSAGWAFRDLPQ